jgi:hypothetical protein
LPVFAPNGPPVVSSPKPTRRSAACRLNTDLITSTWDDLLRVAASVQGAAPSTRPTHHENVHFYGTHSVDIDGKLAQLDADGYRPRR